MDTLEGLIARELVIDPENGAVYRIQYQKQPCEKYRVGTSVNGAGYNQITVTLNGKPVNVKVHRLVWYAHHGVWPVLLDHRDRVKTNNRVGNLREASTELNANNVLEANSHSTSKLRGVSWNNHAKKFIAYIWMGKKNRHLGCFDTAEDANATYLAAKEARLLELTT